MRAKLIAAAAILITAAVLGVDLSMAHWPAVRNGMSTSVALLIPLLLGILAIRMAKGLITIGAFVLVVLLVGAHVAGRTVLIQMPSGGPAVKIGEPATDFTLAASNGKDTSLGTLRGTGQLVLVFYRGSW